MPTDDPDKVELFMPIFGGKISLFIFTFIIFLQFCALFIASKVIKKIVRSNMSDSYKLASFKNADTFLDLPLYIGLFGSVSSFLLISFYVPHVFEGTGPLLHKVRKALRRTP